MCHRLVVRFDDAIGVVQQVSAVRCGLDFLATFDQIEPDTLLEAFYLPAHGALCHA